MKDESEPRHFSEEDWEQLNQIIGYKEGDLEQLLTMQDRGNILHTFLEVHMKRNASKLVAEAQECLAELSCQVLDCLYLKDSIDQIITFFENILVSQTIAEETAAAVQMTIDGVKRTAQQHVNNVLKDQMRFLLDLDIAAPKITIPTSFCPDNSHATKHLLDLGNLGLCTQDDSQLDSSEAMDMYLQFHLCLSDVSAFLVDGDYCWSQSCGHITTSGKSNGFSFLPVIDKCGIVLKLQQVITS
ncbi:hypothetical protein NE237_028250 [Protea cynaroides]|uniref:Uncharacterized protein n=1 Tax=Protea cynaroides TaxID=273540 RepID=A0A9Q0GPJ3_9MAGN|nr:hypothetical protein NE237_028250 [Protea cynaroides]